MVSTAAQKKCVIAHAHVSRDPLVVGSTPRRTKLGATISDRTGLKWISCAALASPSTLWSLSARTWTPNSSSWAECCIRLHETYQTLQSGVSSWLPWLHISPLSLLARLTFRAAGTSPTGGTGPAVRSWVGFGVCILYAKHLLEIGQFMH